MNVSRLRGSIAPIVTPFNNGAVDEATANLVPERVARMYDLWQADDSRGALDLHYELMPLNEVLFVETNPGPLKLRWAHSAGSPPRSASRSSSPRSPTGSRSGMSWPPPGGSNPA